MTRPYQIGFYDSSLGPGGTTRYLLELLDGLDRNTFHPIFFALERRPWHDALVARGVELVLLHPDESRGTGLQACVPENTGLKAGATKPKLRLPRSVAWFLGTVGETRTLMRLFKKRPVDLLHSNDVGAEPAPLAARLAGVPRIVAFFHVDSTYDFGKRSSWRYRKLERWSIGSLDYAIAPTENTKQDWIARTGLRRYESKTAIIHLGVSADRLQRRRSIAEAKAALGIPADAIVIASMGRLEGHKGYEYLIRALPAILQHQPTALAVIAGKGPLEGELRDLAKQLGVSHALRLLGFVNEIRDVLEAADVYIQPSLCETTGFALLEAGCLCVPLLGSAVGGIPEVIIDGVTGLLFPPRDPEQIAAKVTRLLQEPALGERLGRAAQERVKQEFSPADMVAATSALYLRMLGA